MASAATITVTTTHDPDPSGTGNCATGGSCSLREAVTAAQSGDTIKLRTRSVPYSLTQSNGPLLIATNLTLAGGGARNTVIKQTVSDKNVLHVASGVTATVQGVAITGGHVTGPNTGGGISSQGTLTVRDSIVTQNKADGYTDNGGMTPLPYPGIGGGIYNAGGPLTIIRSTISGNIAAAGGGSGALGGGIYSTYPVTVVNSTIDGNSAQGGGMGAGNGGGIFTGADPNARLTLTNATVAFNKATGQNPQGGNLYITDSGTLWTAKNSIIADGTAGTGAENCAGAKLNSLGYNLEDRNQCGFIRPTDKQSTDPLLATLANYGGPTDTDALLSGSPAINGGNPSGCLGPTSTKLLTDQRGIARPQGSRCDIGAFEFRVPTLKGSPVISGTHKVGDKLTCVFTVLSPDGPPTKTVTWLRKSTQVGTGTTYIVKSADKGHSLRCHVVAKNSAGSASGTSAPVSIPG